MRDAPPNSRSRLKTIRIDSAGKRGLLAALAVAGVLAALGPLKWGLASMAALRSDSKEITEYAALAAPDDPQTRFAAAAMLEASFAPGDIERSLAEYEKAAALSPSDYLLWLGLGEARSRSGDYAGAEMAFKQSLELAPNYARVHWALGNLLVRRERADQGFEHIRTAVAADRTFSDPAAVTAWQAFGGDVSQVRSALGESTQLNASLAVILAKQKRFDEALAIWNGLPGAERSGGLNDAARQLAGLLTEAKRFRDLARISAEISGGPAGDPVGRISNGGFEESIKTQNAGAFEWQIAGGLQPQIAPTSGQRRGGSNSLVLIFNTTESNAFRPVSQTVAAGPGKSYEFEIFYRSDLKTSALFKWEIADAGSGKMLVQTEAVANKSDWAPLRARFTVPSSSDGVIVRLVRENCAIICPVSGNLWFDDASLKSAG